MRVLWRTNEEITQIYLRQADTVYRVCALFFPGSGADAEDAVQSTFLRLMKYRTTFESREHEKAWLIVAASNVCRRMLANGWRRRVDMDEGAAERQAAPFAGMKRCKACWLCRTSIKRRSICTITRVIPAGRSPGPWARRRTPYGDTCMRAGRYSEKR